jgi:hypothetical protein
LRSSRIQLFADVAANKRESRLQIPTAGERLSCIAARLLPNSTRGTPSSCAAAKRAGAFAATLADCEQQTRATVVANKKPGGAGLQEDFYLGEIYFASLAIWLVRRDTFRLAAFL